MAEQTKIKLNISFGTSEAMKKLGRARMAFEELNEAIKDLDNMDVDTTIDTSDLLDVFTKAKSRGYDG